MPPHAVRPAAAVLAAAVMVLTAVAQPPPAPPQPPPVSAAAVKTLTQYATADKYPLKHDQKKAEQARRDRVAWFAAGGLKVFLKAATPADPGYQAARGALELDAVVRAQTDLSAVPDAALTLALRQHLRDAVAAGTTDPLVRYLAEWQALRSGPVDPAAAAAFGRTVDELCRSNYSDESKMTAAYNWTTVVRRLPGDDPLAKTGRAAADRFWNHFERVAADPHPAAGAAVLDQGRVHHESAARVGRTRRQHYEEVADRLARAKAPAAVRLAAEGEFLVLEGWDARGGGLASTVTPDGARVWGERLAEARGVLEKAWEADPARPEAATHMLLVCRGFRLDREELEKWFGRAMAANPNGRAAVQRKLETLHPRWGGTTPDFAGFAWAVANSPNTDAQFPLAAVSAVVGTVQYVGPAYDRNPEAAAKYLGQPTVWAILQTALDRQLAASPRNVLVRSMYARLAGAARQYDAAHVQFQALGGQFNTTHFANREEFDRWAAEARRAVEMKK